MKLCTGGGIKHKDVSIGVEKPRNGTVAQLVEQRTENPCVTGSNPVGTTKITYSNSFTVVS